MKEIIKNCVSYKKRGKLQLRCSKCWLKENCGSKSVVVELGIFSPCSLRVSARRKIRINIHCNIFFLICVPCVYIKPQS